MGNPDISGNPENVGNRENLTTATESNSVEDLSIDLQIATLENPEILGNPDSPPGFNPIEYFPGFIRANSYHTLFTSPPPESVPERQKQALERLEYILEKKVVQFSPVIRNEQPQDVREIFTTIGEGIKILQYTFLCDFWRKFGDLNYFLQRRASCHFKT